MDLEDFKNFYAVTSHITRNKKNVQDVKVPLRKIAVLKVEAKKPGVLQYKTQYSELSQWEEVRVFQKIAGRLHKKSHAPTTEKLRDIFLPSNMECLYPNGRKISAPKFKDLMSLLPYIPQNHHAINHALQPDDNNKLI
ncbi:hypothetical protein C0J52_25041 [Blattella germanica]|nr:hypothetical protein C0J52_25041 [Blattella germanica]